MWFWLFVFWVAVIFCSVVPDAIASWRVRSLDEWVAWRRKFGRQEIFLVAWVGAPMLVLVFSECRI